MELNDPIAVKVTNIPPALLEELDTNPMALQPHYRKMFATQVNHLHFLLRSPTVPMGQRLQAMDLFAKISGAYTSPAAVNATPGQGFSVNIIMNAAPAKQLPKVEVIQETNDLIGNVVEGEF